MSNPEARDLTRAIHALACAVREASEQRQCEFEQLRSLLGLATKQDLREMEARILKEFGERIDPQAVKALAAEAALLEQAVQTHPPSAKP